jgi:hypothetical protein
MSENVSKVLTRITTYDGAGTDPYDHEISLVDSTDNANAPTTTEEPRPSTSSQSTRELAKRKTRESLKEHFTRRRYAKYQQARYDSQNKPNTSEEDTSSQIAYQPEQNAQSASQNQPETQAVDFAQDRLDRGRKNAEKRRRESKRLKQEVSEIDILYENQRGSFFCGIPLYSHSSLLPTDPGSWTNKDLKDSPVNITNAQLPDPSWQWSWRSWYVDMSHDVDEEGWQYSFAFGRSWAWHGTHPWFHSFVRRRRWLRKRVKRGQNAAHGHTGSMNDAHHLNQDYFTIHSKRDRSPVDNLDGTVKTARPSSFISYADTLEDVEPPEEIKDLATLLMGLRLASIDREKIEMVKKFVQQGGEELAYLKDNIRDIMSFLVFQNSRTQLLSLLKQTANEAREHRESHKKEDKPEGDDEKRRIDNLLATIDAANAEIGGLQYWSDRKHVLKEADSESAAIKTIATIFDKPAPKPEPDNNPVDEIKGISSKAEIPDETTGSFFSNRKHNGSSKRDKGKARAYDNEDEQKQPVSTPRLGPDDVFVPGEQD